MRHSRWAARRPSPSTSRRCKRGATQVHAWVERDDGDDRPLVAVAVAIPPARCAASRPCPGAIVVAGYDHHARSTLAPCPLPVSRSGRLPGVDGDGRRRAALCRTGARHLGRALEVARIRGDHRHQRRRRADFGRDRSITCGGGADAALPQPDGLASALRPWTIPHRYPKRTGALA